MTFGSTFGRVFSPTFQPKSQAPAAASSWWLAGGIAAANCIAAYQAKGVADLAASKVNLANPGTYNAYAGVDPSWNATDGWVGNGSGYLKTGITTAVGITWSVIVRFSNSGAYGDSMFWGSMTSGKRWAANINMGTFVRCYIGNMDDIAGAQMTSGVYAFASDDLYKNGSYFGTTGNGINATADEIYLLGYNNAGTPSTVTGTKLQAIAFYNTVISAEQVAALTTAMNLL
jgi:hypothetical protein